MAMDFALWVQFGTHSLPFPLSVTPKFYGHVFMGNRSQNVINPTMKLCYQAEYAARRSCQEELPEGLGECNET